jgi:hypothetical protein
MFKQVTSAFAAGDFQLRHTPVEGVAPVPDNTVHNIAENVAAYGQPLAPLNEATWDRSVYRWVDGYWEVLVDLTTEQELVSALTLHAKLYERDGPRLEIYSVHVP